MEIAMRNKEGQGLATIPFSGYQICSEVFFILWPKFKEVIEFF